MYTEYGDHMKRRKTRMLFLWLFKRLFVLCVLFFVLLSSYYLIMKVKLYSTNEEFIISMLKDSNYYKKYEYKGMLGEVVDKLYKIDLTEPTTLLRSVFLYDNQFDEEYNPDELEETMHISDPNPLEIEEPLVYIYNSHQLENYDNSAYEAYNITPNVMMASYILKEKLNNLGVPTIVEEGDITEFIRLNNWNYDSSYLASRYFINAAKEEYPSLKYFIDIHRDSVSKNISTISIDGKSYARILFVVGLEHKDYKKNLKTMENINKLCNKYYPGLSRGIYKKEGAGVNGIYNQDISPNSILIEVGGASNTIDEVLNTTEAISNILYYYIKGENNE